MIAHHCFGVRPCCLKDSCVDSFRFRMNSTWAIMKQVLRSHKHRSEHLSRTHFGTDRCALRGIRARWNMDNSGERRALRVLVMDDEPMVLEGISMLLESLGHVVIGAADATQALSEMSRDVASPPDLAILDLSIGSVGTTSMVAAQLKARYPQIHLILTSGHQADPAMLNYRDQGFDARLDKPFRLSDLKALIAQILGPS
ncbi:MAG: response regulator [Planctomycetaceae bacterium]